MTIDKIKQIAVEKYGKALTDEQAAGYAEKYGKLSDSELNSISGGCDRNESDNCCRNCGSDNIEKAHEYINCRSCGHISAAY